MIYRTVAALIVIFWMVMTTLLIRNEVNPEDSRLREVPITLVLKLLFLHEQPSDLRIYAGGTPVGHVRFQPRNNKDTGERIVEFTGSIQVQAPDRRRLSWDGTLRMTPSYELVRSDWGVTLQDPGFMRLEVRTKADEPFAHIMIRSKDRILQEMDVALSEAGLTNLAQQFGVGGEIFAVLQQAKAQAKTQTNPTIRARQSSIRYRGERTETYLVSIEHNGQTLIQCQFSQLGQILQAKSPLGYTMQPDDLLP
jgi:hypothetical protein